MQCTKEHNRATNENIMYLSYGFVKVAKDDANLVSLLSAFHNFAPRYENAFWPVLVLSRGSPRYPNFVVSCLRKMHFCYYTKARQRCKYISMRNCLQETQLSDRQQN